MSSESDALNFINKYGVVTLFPLRKKDFPSLYMATKGSREEKFRDSWNWADNLAFRKQIHYGKLVCRQVTLLSLEMFPFFYRLCREEKISDTARRILGFLKREGKTSTTDLRKNLDFWGKNKKSEFLRAINELQMTFAIAIVGQEKPPRMTHVYDIMERWMPGNLLSKADRIEKAAAKKSIIAKLLKHAVISKPEDARKLSGSLSF